MIDLREMEKAKGHQVKVLVNMANGTTKIFQGRCSEYNLPAPGEDEHHNIAVWIGGISYELNDYEIESIEILD